MSGMVELVQPAVPASSPPPAASDNSAPSLVFVEGKAQLPCSKTLLVRPRRDWPHLPPFILPTERVDADHPDIIKYVQCLSPCGHCGCGRGRGCCVLNAACLWWCPRLQERKESGCWLHNHPCCGGSDSSALRVLRWVACMGSQHLTAARLCWMQTFVARQVVYSFQDKSDRASDTLMKMEGMCTNKCTLQVAMLRSLGIPAGYCIVHIYKSTPHCACPLQTFECSSIRVATAVYKDLVFEELYDLVSDVTVHVFCCVFIPEEGRFLRFDATDTIDNVRRRLSCLGGGTSLHAPHSAAIPWPAVVGTGRHWGNADAPTVAGGAVWTCAKQY